MSKHILGAGLALAEAQRDQVEDLLIRGELLPEEILLPPLLHEGEPGLGHLGREGDGRGLEILGRGLGVEGRGVS